MVDWIFVAAADSTAAARERADYICRGENDECVLQMAVEACIEQDKNLYLFNGRYCIDRFMDFGDEGPLSAICIPNTHREFRFEGQNHEYGFQKRFDNGVVLYVSEKALAAADGSEASVLRGRWTPLGIQNGSCLRLENIAVVLANNCHAVRGFAARGPSGGKKCFSDFLWRCHRAGQSGGTGYGPADPGEGVHRFNHDGRKQL